MSKVVRTGLNRLLVPFLALWMSHADAGRSWAASAPAAAGSGHTIISGKVVGVVDGDTLDLLEDGRIKHRIRLAEIDAPEHNQAFGKRSKQSLSDLAYGKDATAECAGVTYERLICKVTVDGTYVSLAQVQRGMAWAYWRYAHDPEILRAHQQARIERLGLWSDPNPTPPWEFRKMKVDTQ